MTAEARAPRVQPAVLIYTVLLAGLAVAATLAVAARDVPTPGTPRVGAYLVLVPLLVVAEHLFVRFRYRGEVSSINLVEAVLAPLLFAWPAHHVVAAAALAPIAVAVLRRNQPVKAAFNVAQWALAAAIGTAVVSDIGPEPGITGRGVVAIAAALAVVGIVNHAAFAGVMGIVRRQSPMAVVRELGPTLAAGWGIGWVVNSLTGLLFVIAYAAHPASVLLFPVPLVVQHLAYRSYAGARTDRLRLAGLHRAARVLATPFDPNDAIESYLREVALAFEAGAVELAVINGDSLTVHALDSSEGGYTTREVPRGGASLEAALVALSGPARIGVTGHPLSSRVEAAGWRNCLAAPLVGDEGTTGALVVLDQGGLEGFEEGELAVIEAFARETAASLVKGTLVAAVLEERQKLAEIVNTTSDAMCTIGADGRVRTWNPACEEITGLPAAAVVGGRMPAEALRLRTLDDTPIQLGGRAIDNFVPRELRITAADGREVRLSCSYNLAREGADRLLVIVARDVTPVEEMELLREQVGELAAAEAAHRNVVERLQEALTPPAPEVEGVELAVSFEASEPTSPTGGDLYDWVVLPSGAVHVAVVDVLGHGVKATRDALAVVSTLRILALQGTPLEELVARADEVLAAGARELVATVIIGRYDPTTGRVRIAGGGHPPALIVSTDGTARQLAAPGGAIGWPGAGSEVMADDVLAPGEALVFYTDGLVEARKDILEGLDVLVHTAAAAPPDSTAEELADLLMTECLAGAARKDDSLVMVLRTVSVTSSSSWTLAPDTAEIAGVRSACAAWFASKGVGAEAVEDLRLVTSELLTNAVRAARTRVRCSARLVGSWATVEVADDGAEPEMIGLGHAGEALSGEDAERGRGLFIVRAVADRVEVERAGGETVVRASVATDVMAAAG